MELWDNDASSSCTPLACGLQTRCAREVSYRDGHGLEQGMALRNDTIASHKCGEALHRSRPPKGPGGVPGT
jgi:hypothetical protein